MFGADDATVEELTEALEGGARETFDVIHQLVHVSGCCSNRNKALDRAVCGTLAAHPII
ncbi:hypothetical protein [Rhizobacter sp. Root404]|jgi:hypothetical protein|uniref:hypothetical protein n=1 Tax=Rhizobacter sp. Root404 TaxID=1736528 RepID=UPI0012F91A13|nr:hypothetical protein [Rhizobacter sp. Root404]